MSLIGITKGPVPDGADPYFSLLISFTKLGAHLKWTMVLGINIKVSPLFGFLANLLVCKRGSINTETLYTYLFSGSRFL